MVLAQPTTAHGAYHWWNQNLDFLQSVKMSLKAKLSGLKWACVIWIHTYGWFVFGRDFSKMCIFSACGWWAPTNFWAFGSLESSEKSRISWGSTNFLEAWNVRAQKTFEQQFCFTWEVFCPIGSDMFCTLCDSLGRSLVFACKHFHFRFLLDRTQSLF